MRAKGKARAGGKGTRPVWRDQCDATRIIKERFGKQQAFSCLIAQKLVGRVRAAERDGELLRELPEFLAELRKVFSRDELEHYFRTVKRGVPRRVATGPTPDSVQSVDDMEYEPVV